MRIRFGYVAMSLVVENCSPSRTITVKNLEKIEDYEARIARLRRITAENLQNCLRLLYHNKAHKIHVFRLTSKLVPLATHPIAQNWDYISDFGGELEKMGDFIIENEIRVSSHPDHFTLINSLRPEVLEASLKDLDYHDKMFEAMNLEKAEMVIHVGGLYGSKQLSMERFYNNFSNLPDSIKKRILLENDDKSFNANDVLGLCKALRIPMVFDVHHHYCLNSGNKVEELLPKVFDTWQGKIPKIHFSSPKSPENCRAHADDIDPGSFYDFLLTAREFDQDFDVMIEAKNKDVALFNLMKNLQGMKGVNIINEAEISM